MSEQEDYSYPIITDEHLQYKLYKKRELYVNKTKEPQIKTYADIKKLRDSRCNAKFLLHQHQHLAATIINPDTPYTGLLCFHGTGTGKCVHGDTIINDLKLSIEDVWTKYHSYIFSIQNTTEEWSIPNNKLLITCLDDTSKKFIKYPVKKLYREYINSNITQIIFENGIEIKKTLIHKLYTTEGWKNNIQIGDSVFCYDYNTYDVKIIKVLKIMNIFLSDYVYDLEVDKYHNYIANNLICHNTCLAFSVAERFIDQVKKYNTKIYILVPGTLLKQSWKDQLLLCYGDKIYNSSNNSLLSKEEIERNKAEAINTALLN